MPRNVVAQCWSRLLGTDMPEPQPRLFRLYADVVREVADSVESPT